MQIHNALPSAWTFINNFRRSGRRSFGVSLILLFYKLVDLLLSKSRFKDNRHTDYNRMNLTPLFQPQSHKAFDFTSYYPYTVIIDSIQESECRMRLTNQLSLQNASKHVSLNQSFEYQPRPFNPNGIVAEIEFQTQQKDSFGLTKRMCPFANNRSIIVSPQNDCFELRSFVINECMNTNVEGGRPQAIVIVEFRKT